MSYVLSLLSWLYDHPATVTFVVPLLPQDLLINGPHRFAIMHLLLMTGLGREPPFLSINEALIKVGKPPIKLALDRSRLGGSSRFFRQAVPQTLDGAVHAHETFVSSKGTPVSRFRSLGFIEFLHAVALATACRCSLPSERSGIAINIVAHRGGRCWTSA